MFYELAEEPQHQARTGLDDWTAHNERATRLSTFSRIARSGAEGCEHIVLETADPREWVP